MSAGKTIIVPQGVINPNTLTIIEIPAQSQHESVFVANVTASPERNMNCEYLYNSNVEPPRQFRPRFESTPYENRPERDLTPDTIPSAFFGNQSMTDSFSEGTMDYNDIFRPDYETEASAKAKKSMKLTSQTSITHLPSDTNMGGVPSRRMVTTTNLTNVSSVDRPYDVLADIINMSAVERHRDDDITPDWLRRNDGIVDSPASLHDMEFCNAESTRVDPHPGPMDHTDASGSMRASMFQRLMGDDMQRQIVMPMLSPIQGARYTADGMPIGMSPSRSYYRRGQVGEHDRRIVSTITTDENTGMTTGNVSRSGQTFGQSSAMGELCAGSVCAGGTYCKSADLMGMNSPATPVNFTAPVRTSTPQTYKKSPQGGGVAYMQALPTNSVANATYNQADRVANATYNQADRVANATVNQRGRGANPCFNQCGGAANVTYNQAGRAANATYNQAGRAANATYNQAGGAANATYNQAGGVANATRIKTPPARRQIASQIPGTYAQNRTPTNRRNIPQDNNQYNMLYDAPSPKSRTIASRTQSPGSQRVATAGAPNTMETVLLMAEKREHEMIQEDLRMLQQQRRRLFEGPNMEERREHRRDLFGADNREDSRENVTSTGCRRRARGARPSTRTKPWK